MNINATLFGQMITFALFVWFTMRFVWPHITKALEDRETKIADGLAAAERGQRELELSQTRAKETLRIAKANAAEIIDRANKQATQIVDEAKVQARAEGLRLIEAAKSDIAQEVQQVKNNLRKQVGSLAVLGAEQILGRQIDQAANSDILDKLIKEL